ncbi:MAG: Fe-S metabolism protein SufE [Candidatus Pelagibacter sp.]|nr:Fe-S metabolism protein SufE [Candidatus Pelagibacter sp.]OUV97854.1 MAG: Fe-S metabolism protein SufE [Candidatus Pelagibacter sp. TMED142]|tara:strand:+ start:226 stop:621 length:396 start_codon:yes stop_codon:yes gene_type:complete
MIVDKIKSMGEEISTLDNENKLQYLIDLAKDVNDLDDQYKIDNNKIFGCASNLWVVAEKKNGKIFYKHDADAFITKGTAKLVIDILNGEEIKNVAQLKKEDFKSLGIMELLTAQRQNGLGNLLERLIKLAS